MGANESSSTRYVGGHHAPGTEVVQYGGAYQQHLREGLSPYASGAEEIQYGGYHQQASSAQQYPGNTEYQGTVAVPGGAAGPLGANNPNMVWDEARGGYWVKETVVNQGQAASEISGYGSNDGYTVYNGQPGKITRRTRQCCDAPQPCEHTMVVHNQKKVIHNHYDSDSDEEITIISSPRQPPVFVSVHPPPCSHPACPPPPPPPPPQPAPQTSIFILQPSCPCPVEKPTKARGPTSFFPEVRERNYKLETQVKQSSCMSGLCGGGMGSCGGGMGSYSGGMGAHGGGMAVISCGPCGGRAGASCSRCSSYH